MVLGHAGLAFRSGGKRGGELSGGEYAIGVDVGGTNLRIAAIDTQGTIVEKIALATEVRAGRQVVLQDLCGGVRALMERHNRERKLVGIGIGVPGIIYIREGRIRESPNLPGWDNYPIREEIESVLGTRVFLENDANAAALGEWWRGRGKQSLDLAMLTLGTGVGGGIVINGRVWQGFLGMAGELGHITVEPEGPHCGCGNRGCLEALASATAVVRMAREAGLKEETAETLYRKAGNGDATARQIFRTMGRALGIALAGLVNTFNFPLYVLTGGVIGAWDQFSPSLLEEVERRSFVYRAGGTEIHPSQLGKEAGLYGAAYLPMQEAT